MKSKLQSRGVRVGLIALAVVGTGGVLAACGAAGDGSPEVRLGMAQEGVQIAWVGLSESSTTDGVNLVTTSSQTRKGKSTGAIRVVEQGGAFNANCGVTFISNRRGVTAAHCVAAYSLGQTFTIEQYNTTTLNINSTISQSTVTGAWPNYTRPVKLTSADGYRVTPLTCTMERRCVSTAAAVACPAGATNSDIALVFCSTRSTANQAVKNWVPVAASDSVGSTVDVWWFHELLNLDTSNVAYTEPYSPNFNWAHYGHLDVGIESANFHYTQIPSERQQLFPLRSTHSKQNVAYRSSGSGAGITTATNVPVCHGTSGSGVFRASTDELLGVVDTGGLFAGGESTVLCSDMNAVIGSSSMNYSSRQFTAIFQALPEVSGAGQRN